METINLGLTVVSPKRGLGQVVDKRITRRGDLWIVLFDDGQHCSYYSDRFGDFLFGTVKPLPAGYPKIAVAAQARHLNAAQPSLSPDKLNRIFELQSRGFSYADSKARALAEPAKDGRPYCVLHVDFGRRCLIRKEKNHA